MDSRTVSITDEQGEWLDSKPSVNLSGLVRETIAKEIEMREKYGDTRATSFSSDDDGSQSVEDNRTI